MVNIQEIRVRQKFSMKSLTFSRLICALNLHFAQIEVAHQISERQNLLEVARTAKGCSKRQKLLKSGRAPSGKA